jgi:hypothetical protein
MKGLMKMSLLLSPVTRKRWKTISNYAAVPLEMAETEDYRVILERVKVPALPSGYDWQYAVVNKLTNVIESRVNHLALSVVVMQNQQQMLNKVRSGEMNGFVMESINLPTGHG